jgi:4,5-DOPA dioxygenase extradiol
MTVQQNSAHSSSNANELDSFQPSPLMPVMFVGHGSPMNAIEDNEFRKTWQQVGQYFGVAARWPRPQLILCISAHWLTRGWGLLGMERPVTIHDFGGFPAQLHAQQYPAPGAPTFAKQIASMIQQPNSVQGPCDLFIDHSDWGFDHGSWSVLKPMFPHADIPVIQMSMDYDAPANVHFELGQQLRRLRSLGVLIVGSGNTVHNLPAMQRSALNTQAFDWTQQFDDWVGRCIDSAQLRRLTHFQTDPSVSAVSSLAHPSYEHFLPLLYCAGAADCVGSDRLQGEGREGEKSSEDVVGSRVEYFNLSYQAKSIAMRSVIWH